MSKTSEYYKHTPHISIIVPVYKAEKYIHRCLDSLLAQTLVDFELLLIDDGSPDRSGSLCDEYAEKDSRIRVFHKKNGGVASARQLGIENTTGEYSIHVDSDDWVEPNMLEELYVKAKDTNADMVICDFFSYINGKKHLQKQEPKSLNHKVILQQILDDKLYGYTWNKLIRTSLYKRNDVCFPCDINYMEDTYVICKILYNPICVSYIPEAYYHYDRSANAQSLTKRTEGTRYKCNLSSIPLFIDKLSEYMPAMDFTYRKITYKKYLWNTFDITKDEILNEYGEINDVIVTQYENKKNSIATSLYVAIKYNYYLGRVLFFVENVKGKLMYIFKRMLI